MRQKTRIWANEECERHVLMGRVSQYLERRGAIPRERKDPASLRVRVEAEHKAWHRRGMCGGQERPPWGSRAQMLDFCFLIILLSTCEGPCVSGHMGILLVFGDQRERETISWTP